MIAPEGLVELVRRAQAGEPSAEDELLNRIRPDLERFAQEFGDSSTAVESVSDLAQEAALRCWEKLRQFQGATDDESTAAMLHDWLKQLTRRLAANRHDARHAAKRRPGAAVLHLEIPAPTDSQKAVRGVDPLDRGLTPSEIVSAAEADLRVQKSVNAIPDPTNRRILELRFLESLSLRAVSERLNISYDDVRARYHDVLRTLESDLEGLL